jgi:cbb3-type cytochrome oxidase maturation protein
MAATLAWHALTVPRTMDILFLLVPLSALLVLAIIGVFAWALQGGQFDNVEREGARILEDDASIESRSASRLVDSDQASR